MADYITVNTLKTYVNDKTESPDTLYQQAITAACKAIDNYTGRRFDADTVATTRIYRVANRLVCDPDGDLLMVDDISSLSGLVVEVGSGSSWTVLTDYDTEPENALAQGKPITYLRRPYYSWTVSLYSRVRVTAKFGYPAVPSDVVQAAYLLAARLFKRKDSVDGVRGVDSFGNVHVSRIDPDVQALLQPYVIKTIG